MFEILKGALSTVLGGKTPEGENQLLSTVQTLLTGNREKQRQFELEFERLLQERVDKEIEDRQDARGMQKAALSQNDTFSKRFLYYLSAGIMFGAMVANLAPIFVTIPEESMVIVNKSMDFFNYVVAGGIISFFYGTKLKTKNNGKDSEA